MDEYAVQVVRSARKEIERLSAIVAARVIAAIEALARTPRPRGCRKLRGTANLWRIRSGEYRIYSIDDERLIVRVVIVRHRREAYE